MARTVKEEEYTQRRNEILDAAQKLIYTKGYEQMSIQDILDALGISKGAFYHYFDSKQALLEALTERSIQTVMGITVPIIRDPSLSALKKFQCYMDTAVQWKTANKDYLLALFRTWYVDDNTIVRHKLTAATLQNLAPLFAEIIFQGIQERVFACSYPEQTAQIVLAMLLGLSETIAPVLLSLRPGDDFGRRFECTIAAYNDAIERVLGAQPGTLRLVEPGVLDSWVA